MYFRQTKEGTQQENAARFIYVYKGFQRKEQTLATAANLEDVYNRVQVKLKSWKPMKKNQWGWMFLEFTSLETHLRVHEFDDVSTLEAEQGGFPSKIVLHSHHKLVTLKEQHNISQDLFCRDYTSISWGLFYRNHADILQGLFYRNYTNILISKIQDYITPINHGVQTDSSAIDFFNIILLTYPGFLTRMVYLKHDL